jgi:colanic acid biosynthesis glycosyl transferase WcaI
VTDLSPSVLIVTRTYPPDPAAVGHLVAELAAELAARGWRVGIATTTSAAGDSESTAGVEVKRVTPWFAFSRESTAKRALSYLSIFPALLRAAWALPGPWDLIVTTSDPPLQVLLGPILRATKKGRVVQWSQDLYPELAEELGVLPPRGATANFLRVLSNWGLRRSDLVIVPGRCMAARMRARGLAPDTIQVVPNWSPPSLEFAGDRTENPFWREQGLEASRFVVMYSGNFGLAHRFDEILDAAEKLQSTRPEIVFLMIGDGPRADAVRRDAERRNLANVRFLPLQPRERLSESLGAADVHLITMRDGLSGLVVPSKFYGVLAAGRPSIFIGPADSEVALAIGEGDCGAVVADAAALAASIVHFADDSNARTQAGARARALAANFSIAASANELLTAWQMTAAQRGEGG